MYSISKTFIFCYGHRLLKDDGKCRNLHGHTAKAAVTISSGKLDELGMVVHFEKLKETIGAWISENLDHNMLLSKDDPLAAHLEKTGERHFKMEDNPTAENIARLIHDKAKEFGLSVSMVEVFESETSVARFF
jgi:6-pyruvoyltetrahydropterin/6-carboxytetrahydropterin synthase